MPNIKAWEEYTKDQFKLMALLRLANYMYRIGEPIMDDDTFDALQDMAPLIPIEDDKHSFGTKVAHEVPMLSQQKTYSYTDIEAFEKRINDSDYFVSLKLDGFAVSLEYEFGTLRRASTRGSGEVGTDITEAVIRGCTNIPLTIDGHWGKIPCVEVRGEMVIKKAYGSTSKTARSICVGLFSRKETDGIIDYEPAFIAYDLVSPPCNTMEEKLQGLAYLNFDIVPGEVVRSDEVVDKIDELARTRGDYTYDSDGIVVRCNKSSLYKKAGETPHHPKGAIAFKFSPKAVIATVIGIEMSVGKTGRVTPIAQLEPVQCGGCIIKKASIGSVQVMQEKGIQKGSKVTIVRKGGVIPYIEEVVG